MNKEIKTDEVISYPAAFAWLGLAGVYLGFLSVGFVFHFLPPILPVVIADLGISHGEAGLLMSLFALPGILLSLPGGWLVDRYGERLVGSLGVVVMGLGTLILGLATDFSLILLARVLSGMGGMVGVVALQRLVVRLFAGRRLGLPVGISGSAVPVGIVIVLNVAGPMATTQGWRIVAQWVGGVTMGIGVVFGLIIWFITRGQSLGRNPQQHENPKTGTGQMFRPIWIAGAVWFCANGAMTAFMTFAPDYFQGLGFDVSARGLFTSIPMWTSALLGMVVGWYTDRHGGRAVFMTTGMALMGASLLLLPAAVVSPSLIGLMLGFSLAAVVTPTIALPGALLPATHIGRGYGILSTCANLGIFIVPPLAGFSRDSSGSYVWPFAIMGFVALIGVVAANMLRRGRFMPGFSRQVLAVVALLMVVGCGHQDRYTVVPVGNNGPDVLDLGHMSNETMFLQYGFSSVSAAAAWSADDFVVAGSFGQIIRVQGDRYTSLRLPVREIVVGMVCRPDGDLVAGLYDGSIWQWSEGIWQQWPDSPSDNLGLLMADHQGRLVAGPRFEREVYRFQDDSWVLMGDDFQGNIIGACIHADETAWLATTDYEVLQLTEAGVASVKTLNFEEGRYGRLKLAGDNSGRLAASSGYADLWLLTDGVWTYFYGSYGRDISQMVWFEGELYAWSDKAELVVWGDGTWQVVAADKSMGPIFSIVEAPDEIMVISGSGAAFAFAGQPAARISQGVGRLEGVAEFQGQLMAYLAGGELYRAEDAAAGIWDFVGKTMAEATRSDHNNLLLDDRGLLVAYSYEGLSQWDGNSFTDLVVVGGIHHMQRLPSGEIVLATPEALGSLRGGLVTWWNYNDQPWGSVKGVQRHSATELDVLRSTGLYRLDISGESRLLWVGAGWTLDRLIPLAEAHAVVVGRYQTYEINGDDIRDVTPYITTTDPDKPVILFDVAKLPGGELLAWAGKSRGLWLRNEAGWWTIDALSGATLWNDSPWSGGSIVQTETHGILLFSSDFMGRIDLTGGE